MSFTLTQSIQAAQLGAGGVTASKQMNDAYKGSRELLNMENPTTTDYLNVTAKAVSAGAAIVGTYYGIQGFRAQSQLTEFAGPATKQTATLRKTYDHAIKVQLHAAAVRLGADHISRETKRQSADGSGIVRDGLNVTQIVTASANLCRDRYMRLPLFAIVPSALGISITSLVTAVRFEWWSKMTDHNARPIVIPSTPSVPREPSISSDPQISVNHPERPQNSAPRLSRNEIPSDLPNEIPDRFHKDPILSQFICPFTQSPIRFPATIKSSDGEFSFNFEKSAIIHWIEECRRQRNPIINPYTREEFDPKNLVENLDLQALIENRLRVLNGGQATDPVTCLHHATLNRLWNSVLHNPDFPMSASVHTEAKLAAPVYMRNLHKEVYRLCHEKGLVRKHNPHFGSDAFLRGTAQSAVIDTDLRFKALVNVEIEHLKASITGKNKLFITKSLERLERYNRAYVRDLYSKLVILCKERGVYLQDPHFARKAMRGAEGFQVDPVIKLEAIRRCKIVYNRD